MTKSVRIERNHNENDAMTALDARISNVETGIQQINIELVRINTRLDTELPHLATKAEFAAVEGRLETRIAAAEGKLETRIAEVEGKLEARIAAAEGKLEARIAGVEGKLEAKIGGVEGRLDTKIATVEGRLSAEIIRSKNTIIIWLIGIAIATGFVNWGTTLFSQHFHSSSITTQFIPAKTSTP